MTPPDATMPGGFGRMERMVVFSAIGFVLVLLVAAVLSGGHGALAALRAVPGWAFALMLGLSSFNYLCRALRWLLFSHAMGVRVPVASNALYYLAGFAMTTTPGKLGEALRLWFLRRAHGCRYADTVGLLIADRLWDAVAMSAVLCVVGGVAGGVCVGEPVAAAAIVGGGDAAVLASHRCCWRRWALPRGHCRGAGGCSPHGGGRLRKLGRLARPDVFALGARCWGFAGLVG